jgi:hypothetical protein
MNPALIQVMIALLTVSAQLLTELAKMRQQKQGSGRKG